MTRKAVFHDTGSFDDGTPITVFPAAVASVFGRTGVVAAAAGDYFGAMPAALTGATQAARFVGATTSGAPVSGTFAVGDVVVARDGKVWVCTVLGTPGTWVDVGGGASVSYATPAVVLGSSAAAGAASTVIRSDSTIAAFDATSPSTQAFGDAAAVGTAAFAARRDHKHAMPANPLTEYDYVERTTNLTVTGTGSGSPTTAITGNSVSYDGSTRIKIEAFFVLAECSGSTTTDVGIIIALKEDSTLIGICSYNEFVRGSGFGGAPQYGCRYRTPAAGSHTYTIVAWKSGTTTAVLYCGDGVTSNYDPGFLRVTKA